MKLDNVSANNTIQKVEELLEREKTISPALRMAIKILIELMALLIGRLNIDSKNSSKPPSEDKNRSRGRNREKSDKKPGGQNGHIGTKLKKVNDPDKVEQIDIDRRKLPKGMFPSLAPRKKRSV